MKNSVKNKNNSIGLLKEKLNNLKIILPPFKLKKIIKKLNSSYNKNDAWGLKISNIEAYLYFLWPIYKAYFKVRAFNSENVEDENYIICSNHSGQIALDSVLISISMLLEFQNPRVVRPMVDRFFTKIPWISKWASECGAVLGDRQNCINILKHNQSVLIFPEGVSGVSKSSCEYYQLQKFTRGFVRMAIESQVKILPVAVVGAEEIFPWVYQARTIARLLNLPAVPLSPCYLPLPSPVDIYFGKPYELPKDLSSESTDKDIDVHVEKIRKEVKSLIKKGLQKRRRYIFSNKNDVKIKD